MDEISKVLAGPTTNKRRNPCWRSRLNLNFIHTRLCPLCVPQLLWLILSHFALYCITSTVHRQEISAGIHNVHRRRLTRPLGAGVYDTTYQEVSVLNSFTHEPRRGTSLHETEANYLPKNTTSFYPRPQFRAPSSTEHPGPEVDSGFAHSASQH